MALDPVLRNKVIAASIVLVGGFEGLRLSAYYDPVGIPTACFGETKNIKMGMKFTQKQCEGMLAESLIAHDNGMMKCIKVPISDTRHVALLSFTYNVGVGAFCQSTLVRKLNAGDIVGACNELNKWVYAQGIKLPGLVNRRTIEHQWCMKGLT